VGYLLAAGNPLALDVVAGEMMGLDPQKNPVLVEAEKRGLGPTHLGDVEIIGVDRRDLRTPDFKLPSTVFRDDGRGGVSVWQKLLLKLFKGGMSVKPRIIRERCIACGACRDACPMHVITMVNGDHARIDHRGCIRCYCCHEMCPEKAVELHRNLMYRMINR
jgi:ferredoxin